MKTLVLGLGNPILCDDAVGLRVARELRSRLNREDVDVEETSLAGLGLLDILSGYDRVVIIDAIETEQGEPGRVYRLGPGAFDDAKHLCSLHEMNFATALDVGRRLGVDLPQQIIVFAVGVSDTATFSEECTPRVRQAIPVCTEMILRELDENQVP